MTRTNRTLQSACAVLVAAGLSFACQGAQPAHGANDGTARQAAPKVDHLGRVFGPAPRVPTGPLAPAVANALERVIGIDPRDERWGPLLEPVHGAPPGGQSPRRAALADVVEGGDPRAAWVLADLMRFTTTYEQSSALSAAADALLGIETRPENPWGTTVDHLIAWDVPAPPGYLAAKRRIHCAHEPAWLPFFVEGEIDWRLVGWGGVGPDLRPFERTDEPCNCIPAADSPPVTPVADATWLSEDAVVFGVVVGGEARAYPRRTMEVRELVNDTLGGRAIGVPYCTLCGSAQAYLTDLGGERVVLRTSGLLARSNKVSFDLATRSLFDTFRGRAVTGPLAERGVVLTPLPVVTTTFGEWRRAHPEGTVLAESTALGRDFDFRSGRDAEGPIFPVGDVDPRLPASADVFGVVTAEGRALAFEVTSARAALLAGAAVELEGVRLALEGGGLVASDAAGGALAGHRAFWFAWSQFHAGTGLWRR